MNFPGPRTMRSLNKKYLQHDYLTDVICFNYKDSSDYLEPGDVSVEIFISPDMAYQRSRENSELNYSSEMVLYLVHAILHATGLGDKTPSQKKLMRHKETEIMNEINKEFDFSLIFPDN